MRSRLDILEELDIKCGQLNYKYRSYLSTQWEKQIQIMVKGVRVCFTAVVFYAAIVKLSASNGLENQIKKLIFNNNGLGSYSFEFQNEDGTFRKEDGGFISHPSGTQSLVVRGEYGYFDPKGLYHYVKYVADTRGYQPHAHEDDIRYNDRRII